MVRRMRVKKDKSSKLIRLGRDSLKYKFVENSNTNASGYRVMNLDLLKEEIVKISVHSCMCEQAQRLVTEGKDPITIKGELSRSGLYSVILVVCKGCDEQFPIKTSEKQANGLYDINVRAVWGSVTSGGGASNLNEMLGSMNIPPMHEHMFTVLEDKIGSWWENVLKDEMEKAGAEEKRIAIEKGNFHEGLPAITVICDGGWSKRTHKHTYDANGGVAVIFGAATNKLLYIGIRNKRCCICRRAENEGTTPQTHKCHANWKESSQAMEADIILSGFLEAETSHGVRYLNIIADGDSSVYTTLLENVPVWGKDIKKLECANHICKCLRANLEKLVEEKPQYKGKGKLTKLNRIRLATAIRCAIKMRSKTKDHKQLRRDIINSIYHILGFHKHCSDFCQKRPSNLPIDTTDDNNDNNIDDSSFDAIFEDQISMWKIPDDKELENSRLAGKNHCTLSEIKELITDVQIILNRVAEKSDRLIGNFTTNLAESWMAIRSKFDGGKVINRCSRGSWYTRCYGGALRKNLGTTWSPVTFQTVTNVQAGVYFNKLAKKQDMKLRHAKKYKEKPESKLLKRKRKLQSLKVGSTKKAKISYGSKLDDTKDVSSEKLDELCDEFFEKNVVKTDVQISSIQESTGDQFKSELWKKERHKRLTSSNFGKIMSRRPTNNSVCIVERMLYNKFTGNMHTIRGLTQESNTILEYKNFKGNVEVNKTGLRICKSHPFLAASTDGIVHDKEENEHGLIEVKNFLQTNIFMIKEATKAVKNFCLQEVGNKIQVKRNHEIYYQIQGQLNIFEMDWCDFVLRRTNPYDIYVERIYRDKPLWEKQMVPKLQEFYFKFLLPELALPRYGTYSGIRKPKIPWIETCKNLKKFPKSGKSGKKSVPDPNKRKRSVNQVKEPNRGENTVKEKEDEKESKRKSRRQVTKFVGRQIRHKRCPNNSQLMKWYTGTVLDVLRGKDGDPDAVFQILYKGEQQSNEVCNVLADYQKGLLQFKDI